MQPKTVRDILIWGSAVAAIAPFSAAQPTTPASAKGLAPILADDSRVISELARRDLATLRDYMFEKNNVSKEQQASYLAVSALRQLGQANLTLRQRRELISNVAIGIDKVLATMDDPVELMKLNKLLVENGTTRGLNTLEYWGENARTQAQVRPVAEAIDRVYVKAIATAQAAADKVANEMTPANQNALAPQWEKAMQLVGLATFNRAFNLYTLALSMDRNDPKRVQTAQRGIELLKEYEDPQYQIQPATRVEMGKLHLAMGGEALKQSREKFAQVLADDNAHWTQKYEAVYFLAICDLTQRDPAAARQALQRITSWLNENAPPDDAVRQGAEAANKMLEYRIASLEAELAENESAAAAKNQQAIAVLQDLLRKRPDLATIINEQLVTKLPENPDMSQLNPLLLRAIVANGNDEITKDPAQPADTRTLRQAVAAAREIVRRAGRDGITAEDADRSVLLLAFFHARLGDDLLAATTFLDHLDKYRASQQRTDLALENAAAAVAKLRREKNDAPGTQEVYARFLQTATAPPFSRKQFNLDYARLLLERNVSAMEGDYGDAQRQQMLGNARKSAQLLMAVDDPARLLYARFFEMLACDQVLDLSPGAETYREYAPRMRRLAETIDQLASQQISGGDPAASTNARWFKVRAALLLANLAQHDPTSDKPRSMEQALKMLSGFEQMVDGLPNAQALLGQARFLRVNFLMSLGRPDEALADLGKFLETRSGDEGIQVVYDMLDSLNKDYQQALRTGEGGRAGELAAHRATVSRYLVERVEKSDRQEVRQLLPKYRMFEARALQEAAALEKEPAKKRQFLQSALSIYEEAHRQNRDDRTIEVDIAGVQYDLANYAAAQPILARLLEQKLLGKPILVVNEVDGPVSRPNNLYWSAMLRLLRCNVQLVQARAPGFNEQVMDDTRKKLMDLYIRYPEPGGPRWAGEFDRLRRQILPDWTVPTLEVPATQSGAAAGKQLAYSQKMS